MSSESNEDQLEAVSPPALDDPFNRIGQVWDFDGSIELIVAWGRRERYVTLVLSDGDQPAGKLDHMTEDALQRAENTTEKRGFFRVA